MLSLTNVGATDSRASNSSRECGMIYLLRVPALGASRIEASVGYAGIVLPMFEKHTFTHGALTKVLAKASKS